MSSVGKGKEATASRAASLPRQPKGKGKRDKGSGSKGSVPRGGAVKGRPVIQYQGKEIVQGPGMWKEIRSIAKATAPAKAAQPTLVRGGLTQGALQALWSLILMFRSVHYRNYEVTEPPAKRAKTSGAGSSMDLTIDGTIMEGIDGVPLGNQKLRFKPFEGENPTWLGRTPEGKLISLQDLAVSFCDLTIPEFAVYQRIQRANGATVPKCAANVRFNFAHSQHIGQVKSLAKSKKLTASAQKVWAAVQSITGSEEPVLDMVGLFKSAGITVDAERLSTNLNQAPAVYWKSVLPTSEKSGVLLDLEVLSKALGGASAPPKAGSSA